MAKSGGVLNAICAKLLKGNLSQGDPAEDSDTETSGKGCPIGVGLKDGSTSDCIDRNAVEHILSPQEKDLDTDKENNNTKVKGSTTESVLVTSEDKEDAQTLPPAPQPTPPPQPSESRRNRRKNVKPRNIVEFRDVPEDYGKDELDEFELNNRDVDFDEICKNAEEEQQGKGGGGSALDLSGSHGDQEPCSDVESDSKFEDSDGSRVLDLSVNREPYPTNPTSHTFGESDSNDDNSHHSMFPPGGYPDSDSNSDLSQDEESQSSSGFSQGRMDRFQGGRDNPSATPVEAVAMKNYAKSTVNELLSMYGLGGEEAEAITQSIPLQKFSTGHILQSHPGLGPQHRGVKRPAEDSPKPAKQGPQKVSGEVARASPQPPQSSNSDGHLSSAQSSLASFVQHIPNEGMYAKFVDSFSKLAKLPQGTMIGNPPVLLPGNPMAAMTVTSHSQLPPMTSSPGKTSVVSKFATSSEYVKACFNPALAPKLAAAAAAASGGKALLPDYSKYIKRFATYELCGGNHCRDMSYKEHFHCMDCSFRVFVKKEEMIRHFKWHKKRDESLQHGFMRYSPMDDCAKKFGTCTHNGRQTHYHCLQPGCNKVYISTSDTQMHANYHRKDSAIIQEGFQRFRATEDCGTQACSFYGQRTTHFHCRRQGCNFTFKNKADMEKHKAYHQKDEILGRDGFKKFMKYEHCRFQSCRYSKVSNHIHCIRPGCEYVLHSTGQLYSHKRRHERRDFEHAYRRFRDEQKKKTDGPGPNRPTLPTNPNHPPLNQASSSMSPAHSSKGPAHPKMSLGHHLPTRAPHQNSPKPMLNPALTTPNPIRMPASAPKPTPNPAHLMLEHAVKQEEYIDLEDLNRYNQSKGGPTDSSLTPTDLSLSSTSSSGSLANIKQEPLVIAPKVEPSASIGLDLSNNSNSCSQAQPSTLAKLASKLNSSSSLNGSLNLPIPSIGSSNEESDMKPKITDVKSLAPAQGLTLMPGGPGVGASPGVQGFIPKSSPAVNEKREKDESWKKYLTRYTANDPCHPRCQFLYKDHYHCNIEGCGMIFRNKDGVREHARYHEQQDRITLLSFRTFDTNSVCVPKCLLNQKALHYHCLWANCGAVVRTSDPPFTRLEHHKIHEYARAASSRQPRPLAQMRSDHMKRRRGRPPKYPKTEIPVVPKVEMSEGEIAHELRRHVDGSQNTLLAGFKKFAPFEACPDERCIFISKAHYHCVRPRCHHATDRADVLNLHAKDFHSYINILDGFEFFDRTVNCRRPHCHNNKANKHFHCVRSRCDYSFVRYSTMAQHDKKHKMMELGKDITQQQQPPKLVMPQNPFPMEHGSMLLPNTVVTTNTPISVQPMRSSPQVPAVSTDHEKNVIKTAGTFYPLTSLPHSSSHVITPMQSSSTSGPVSISVTPPGIIHASTNAPMLMTTTAASMNKVTNVINIAPKLSQSLPLEPMSGGMPLTMLLQQRPQQSMPTLNWLDLKVKMHYDMAQNCGRPFCKLKKKDHFHCFDCNQAFSDPSRLRAHIIKHGVKVDGYDNMQGNAGPLATSMSPTPITIQPIPDLDSEDLANFSDDEDEDEQENQGDEPNPSSSLNLDASSFTRLMETGTLKNMEETPVKNSDQKPAESVSAVGGALDLSVMYSPLSSTPKPKSTVSEESREEIDNSNTSSNAAAETIDQPGNDSNDQAIEKDSETPNSLSPVGSPASSVGRRSGRKRTATRHDDFVDSDTIVPKQRKLSSPKPSTPAPQREENVPDGYQKYRFSDDCEHERCAYRLGSSHYHCMRDDCRYSFSDRTRAAQHTQKHERIDSATGEEFQQFSASTECDRGDCEHSKTTSHYHCLKCLFICTDTSKVLAHRKHHMKMDTIASKGFEKYGVTEDCQVEGCSYKDKQTHYHCTHLQCQQAVLGPAQMGPHQLKHVNSPI